MANLILSSIPRMGPRAHQFSATARAYYAGATTAARTQPTIAPTRSYAGAIRYYEPNEHARGGGGDLTAEEVVDRPRR
jgi:hypothetical protein